MKKKAISRWLPVVVVAIVVTSIAAPAHASGHKCSMARSAGNFAFTDNGTVVGVGPRTAAGVFTFDGAGNLTSGAATASLNGNISQETFSGTYTVNSDCTGSGSVTIYSGGTEVLALTLSLAFDDDMKEMRAIFSSASLPDGTQLYTVINLEAKKQ